MVDFTVAIRAYNSEQILPNILDKLRSQVNTEDINWEVIVVDNNSTDNTAKIIREYQDQWNRNFPLKYYLETQQGASYARHRCIHEAQGALVGFLDDDNLPAPDWVAAAYTFGQAYPGAGAYSGQIHGVYEVEPPPNFQCIAAFIPVIERGNRPLCYTSYQYSHKKVLPPGAGLVIRKEAWLDSVTGHLVLRGPVGNSLTAKGEDIEALSYMVRAGWEVWFNPLMHIYHYIPKWRFEREYLIKFFRGIGLSRHRTRMLGYQPWQRPFIFPAYFVNDLRKLVIHFFKYRQVLDTDVVAAAQMQFFLSCLVSPFYIWKNQLTKT